MSGIFKKRDRWGRRRRREEGGFEDDSLCLFGRRGGWWRNGVFVEKGEVVF